MHPRRLFIVDHMAVLPFGHNLNCMTLFAAALGQEFDVVHRMVPRELASEAEESSATERVLHYPYTGVLETRISSMKWLPPKARTFFSETRRRLALYGRIALSEWFGWDGTRARTARNWKKILKKYQITSQDVIFFPSADHYGVVALFDALSERGVQSAPRIHLRMIGVMETSAYRRRYDVAQLLAEVEAFERQSGRVSLSAETPRYAGYLQTKTVLPVTYLPYPLGRPSVPLLWGNTKVMASPGQGRADKGFLRLQSIAKQMFMRKGRAGWKLRVQDMRIGDPDRQERYSRSLAASPNVELLASRLSQTAVDAIYAECDVLLLPYDRGTYYLRGSAVFQEGIATGRPVICAAGTAIADLVLLYGNGRVATDDADIAQKAIEMFEVDRRSIEEMVRRARDQYHQDFELAATTLALSWKAAR
jgi:hypothetical protein